MDRSKARAWAVTMIALFAACSDDPTSVTQVARIEVGPADAVIAVGDSVELTALAVTADGDVVVGPVQWRSLNPTTATLRVGEGKAVVEGKAAGTAWIEATSGGRAGTVKVTVTAAQQVAEVELQPATLVLQEGQEAAVQAVARAASGAVIEGRTVTWSVEGVSVTIAPTGTAGWATVTADAEGGAIIRATIDGVTAAADVQVVAASPPPAQVASVTITPSSFSLPVQHETPLQAIAKDAAGAIIAGLPVTWVSTADAVASITPIGVSPFATLLGLSAGTTRIRATVGGVTGEITVQITAAPPPAQQVMYLFVIPSQRGIWIDQVLDYSQHLSAIGRDGRIDNPAVTWTVEDPSIASVDAAGRVHGLKKGTTRLHVSSGAAQATAQITVFEPWNGTVAFDLTYDWWDMMWHAVSPVGSETWTDEAGVAHEVELYPTIGSLTLATDGRYERVLRLQGWANVDGSARLVIDREVRDVGVSSIMVGGETGFRMISETTPGLTYEVVQAYNAGHVIMRAAIGTAAVQDYLFRMRQ